MVDFPEFLRQVESGRFRAATDVFPQEPAPRDEPARKVEGLLLSPHRAGAMIDSLYEIGRQTVADAGLILRGLPPLSCRRAQRETVARSRSKADRAQLRRRFLDRRKIADLNAARGSAGGEGRADASQRNALQLGLGDQLLLERSVQLRPRASQSPVSVIAFGGGGLHGGGVTQYRIRPDPNGPDQDVDSPGTAISSYPPSVYDPEHDQRDRGTGCRVRTRKG